MELKDPTTIVGGAIAVYDDVLYYYNEIIEVAESMRQWRDATVYSFSDDESSVSMSVRSNKILDVNWTDETSHPIFDDMNNLVAEYLSNYAIRFDVGYKSIESSQILRYDVGEEYKQHFDTGPRFPRVISALLYLNDVDHGGETEFVHFNIKVRPRKGRLVIFPSNYAYAHIAHPPTEGYKYVTVYWTEEEVLPRENHKSIII